VSHEEAAAPRNVQKDPWWRKVRTWVIVVGIALVGVAAFYVERINRFPTVSFNSTLLEESENLGVEEQFIKNVSSSNASDSVLSEWREARADHKIVALAIANCKQIWDKFNHFERMPPRLFSLLLLDLTPIGGHEFSPGVSSVDTTKNQQPKQDVGRAGETSSETELTHYEQSMLLLSDAIARARLEAAKQADSTTTKAIAFGWITVALSGLATLFVAIKASMPVPQTDVEDKAYRGAFYVVGYVAMIISATVTVLSSAKQFYDPQRTYKSSEAALLELRKLQKQVSFEFISTWDNSNCLPEKIDVTDALKSWSQRLANIEGVVVEASANLQDADLLKSEDLDKADSFVKIKEAPQESVTQQVPVTTQR
jgi:hypothetical protein